MARKEKITALLEQLNTGIFEKEKIMALALLSSIAGESIFLLGPPGVAKSLIARRLKYACKDGTAFEYLMSRFSAPDEIFGPVAISKLQQDIYERQIEGYLPAATVVFLDEIWKAGPSIQNALLTILNEKVFRNGAEEIKVPMKALISASNELPAKDQGLEALWDRFLIRYVVEGIQDEQKFNEMITMPSTSFEDTISDKITKEEYQEWSKAIDGIAVPQNVFNVIHVIRNYLAQHNEKEENAENQIYVSDRRWRKIVRLLRTSAFLNDRTEVDLMDCFLIKHCIWNEKEQRQTVSGFVKDSVEKHGYKLDIDFSGIKKELAEFQTEINEETKFVKDTRKKVLEPVHQDYYEIINPPDANGNLLRQADFNNLSNANQSMNLYYWDNSSGQIRSYSNYIYNYNIRKGNATFSIFIEDKEYKLKTMINGEKRQTTKKPHQAVEKAWDERVNGFLKHTGDMKAEIEQYRNKDLEHLRTNLFVKPALANIVESHIAETQKKIEKLELAIREIQHSYQKLKDEEVVVND